MSLPRLYAILDVGAAARYGWAMRDLARAYLEGGARLLQVRAKEVGSRALADLCADLVDEARPYEAAVIVNDRVDIALMVGATGVHVGQDDLPVSAVRKLVGPRALVGLSTHTREQIDRAAGEAVSYLAVGPVFDTDTKATGLAAVGLELITYAASSAGCPVVAIGGITLERAASVIAAGASSVAVISDLLRVGDPAARVHTFVQSLERA